MIEKKKFLKEHLKMPDDFLRLPNDVDELIAMLDEQYPERCPDPDRSDRDIWIAVGARQVVRLLLSLKDERDTRE